MKKMNPGMMAIMAKKKATPMKMSAGGKMPMKDGQPAFLNDGKGMRAGGKTAAPKKMMSGGMAMKTGGKACAPKKMSTGGAAKKKNGKAC